MKRTRSRLNFIRGPIFLRVMLYDQQLDSDFGNIFPTWFPFAFHPYYCTTLKQVILPSLFSRRFFAIFSISLRVPFRAQSRVVMIHCDMACTRTYLLCDFFQKRENIAVVQFFSVFGQLICRCVLYWFVLHRTLKFSNENRHGSHVFYLYNTMIDFSPEGNLQYT